MATHQTIQLLNDILKWILGMSRWNIIQLRSVNFHALAKYINPGLLHENTHINCRFAVTCFKAFVVTVNGYSIKLSVRQIDGELTPTAAWTLLIKAGWVKCAETRELDHISITILVSNRSVCQLLVSTRVILGILLMLESHGHWRWFDRCSPEGNFMN